MDYTHTHTKFTFPLPIRTQEGHALFLFFCACCLLVPVTIQHIHLTTTHSTYAPQFNLSHTLPLIPFYIFTSKPASHFHRQQIKPFFLFLQGKFGGKARISFWSWCFGVKPGQASCRHHGYTQSNSASNSCPGGTTQGLCDREQPFAARRAWCFAFRRR